MDSSSVQILSAALAGVVVPLTSLALLSLGCGDNRRHTNKKKAIGSQRKKTLSKKTHESSKKPGQISSTKATKTDSKKKGAAVKVEAKKPKVELPQNVTSFKNPSKKGSTTSNSKTSLSLDSFLQKQLTPKSSLIIEQNMKKLVQPPQVSKTQTSAESEKWTSASASKKLELTGKNAIPYYCSENADVSLEPQHLSFEVTGGTQQLNINSKSSVMRYAVKVKCSDNDLYRVNPVHAFLEPGKKVHLSVYRNGGVAKIDKLVVLVSEVAKDETDATLPFGYQDNKSISMVVIPLFPIVPLFKKDAILEKEMRVASTGVVANY